MHAKRPEDSCINFGAGTAVQLDLFCSASHSMEPGAHVGWVGCGLSRCCSASSCSALRRVASNKPQPFMLGLSISRAPLQASTSSSWARSGNPSRTRNRSSFQRPRRIFTLPTRHCELNGPNLVTLLPLSPAEVTSKPLSARTRWKAWLLPACPGSLPKPTRTRRPSRGPVTKNMGIARDLGDDGPPFALEIEPGGRPDLPIAAQQPLALEQRQRQQPGEIFGVDLQQSGVVEHRGRDESDP